MAPNPCNFVTVQLGQLEEEQEAVLEIYNQYGQLVLRKDYGVVGQLDDRIDIRQFHTGIYIVSMKVGGERFEQRLLVNKN
ncbi:MAG: T9SS type A sorting domain-containing protein [Saprospiraceae bacterium]|nr:T9SS type A sorting domain-containing protein [Saprospiraceae bacterium]